MAMAAEITGCQFWTFTRKKCHVQVFLHLLSVAYFAVECYLFASEAQ